jgi:hypothetical protein
MPKAGVSKAQALDGDFALEWFANVMNDKINRLGVRKALAAYNAGEAGMRAGKGFGYADKIISKASR